MSFHKFLRDFPYVEFFVSAGNMAGLLAIFHWFPWSYHIGRKLTNYEAFVSGCLAVLMGFAKYCSLVAGLKTWVALAVILVLFHWPAWAFEQVRQVGRVRSFVIASTLPMVTHAAWSLKRRRVNDALALAGLYAIGLIVTLGFYKLDEIGEHRNANRINNGE